MTRVLIFSHDFTASNGSDLLTEWGFTACPDTAGLLVNSNGVYGSAAPAEQGNSLETTTTDGAGDTAKATFADEQWASILNNDTLNFSPGAMVRCEDVNGDDYACSPITFSTGLEIVRHDAAVYNQIASGGATTPTAGQRFEIEANGSALEVFIDGVSQVSTTDATYATGMPGVYCYDGTASNIGDDFQCGNLFSRTPVSPFRLSHAPSVARRVRNARKNNRRLYRG